MTKSLRLLYLPLTLSPRHSGVALQCSTFAACLVIKQLPTLVPCSQFGPKVVKPQPIAKVLPTLFDAKQEPVRDGVKQLAVRFSCWCHKCKHVT